MSPWTHEKKYLNNDRILLALETRTEQRKWSSRCRLSMLAQYEGWFSGNARNSQWSRRERIWRRGRQDEIAKARQPLVIKKRGSYASVSAESMTW